MKTLNLLILAAVFCLVYASQGDIKVVNVEDVEGKDIHYNGDRTINGEILRVTNFFPSENILIGFNETTLPGEVSNVELFLWKFKNPPDVATLPMKGFRLAEYWDENFEPQTLDISHDINVSKALANYEGWFRINITESYRAWKEGVINYGIALAGDRAIADCGANFASTENENKNLRPKLKITYKPSRPSFRFPLAGKSPYTARCVAILDHDPAKGSVKAYNGEVGNKDPFDYYNDGTVIGYKNKTRTRFVIPLLNGYVDEVSNTGDLYLFYDNHRGYDYADTDTPIGTPIFAAADGIVIAITKNTSKESGTIWRNKKFKPPIAMKTDPWNLYHAICILHDKGFSTLYLHCDDFSPAVKAKILKQGYAVVVKGEQIATVGEKESTGHPHLHFGSYKGDKLIDPYGNGSVISILWEEQPPQQ